MKFLFLTLFLTVLSFFSFGQSISREIAIPGKTITISSNMDLNDLISILGQYSTVKNGDSKKPQYIWKTDEKDDFSIFIENGTIFLFIIRSTKYSYKNLLVGDSIDNINKIFGNPTSKISEGANTTYYFRNENIRIDVSNKTNLVYGIFLNYFIPTQE